MNSVVAKNTLSQLIGRGVSAIAMFVVTLIVARQFGAAGYGDFVKVTTYVAFFYLIADFGINAIFLQQKSPRAFPALLFLRLVGGAGLVALALFLASILPGTADNGYTPVVRLGILILSPTILLQGLITTANAVFQKHLRYDLAAWAIFFGSVATVAATWNFVALRPSSNFLPVVGSLGLGALVSAVVSLFFARRLQGPTHFAVRMPDVTRLLMPSIPLGITLLFNLVYFRADSFIITVTRPTAEVGIYGLAYKVFELILVFPTFFMNAVYPVLLKQKTVQFTRVVAKSLVFLLVSSILATGVLWTAAPLLTIIQPDFAPSISALRTLALGLPFFFLSAALMWGLIAMKKQLVLATIYGASMIVNVLGNMLLVPRNGFIAAAWMTVASEALVLVLSGIVLVRVLRSQE